MTDVNESSLSSSFVEKDIDTEVTNEKTKNAI
jgi:hypothetical protein